MMIAREITSGTSIDQGSTQSPRAGLEESVEEMRRRAVDDLQAFLDVSLKEPGESKALLR